MNIKEAKKQIKNAMTAYFTKDEFGNYMIPIERQRPVFLVGAPGIGKTAIMEQIAQEMDKPLVTYSMTHHTRQSALGLPFISHKVYDGKEYDVSEYTMSEIISTVYETMEQTGKKEGILFLDEINCVSETLSPIMLQFLQYKVFGKHRVPDGWIVVTAGNPPEYNNSVKEFDTVTWDRLKRIDVTPEYSCWKEYAVNASVHPSVTSYLDIKKDCFYKMESTVDGKLFVTARGWEDLSKMLHLYEKNNIKVDVNLISQYIQDPKIAKSFASYYDLFLKYRSDYQIDKILDGTVGDAICKRAKDAKFDERMSLIGLIGDAVIEKTEKSVSSDEFLTQYLASLKGLKENFAKSNQSTASVLGNTIALLKKSITTGKAAGTMSESDLRVKSKLLMTLENLQALDKKTPEEIITEGKAILEKGITELKDISQTTTLAIDNAFAFLENAFDEGPEMLLFVTTLTMNRYCGRFISKYGSESYKRHNKSLRFSDRHKDILSEIEKLSETL